MKLMEEFKQIGTTKLDSKKRVTLGSVLTKFNLLKDIPISDFETFIGVKGDILLRPMTTIPARELWVHQNPEILGNIQEGIADIKAGRSQTVTDLDKYFEEL
ncbi:MAG: hypothetical protein KAV18_03675 [Candidatus Omnitrophica bacterium]|nr:hypothetical protein [Candidatus Omnitrophota bacterium]MCK4423148.1 hypothetical protein [Candidatus Omnitrophota bacterium]